jgi:hypothetical protein
LRISQNVLLGLPQQYHVVFGFDSFWRSPLYEVSNILWYAKLNDLVKRKNLQILAAHVPEIFFKSTEG